jgi:hypothetical protein
MSSSMPARLPWLSSKGTSMLSEKLAIGAIDV